MLEGLSPREFATRGCARSAENAKPIANAEEPVQVTNSVHLYMVKPEDTRIGERTPDILTRFAALNLAGRQPTTSLACWRNGDAVEGVPTIRRSLDILGQSTRRVARR